MFDVEGIGWFWKNKKQYIDNINSEKEPSEKTIYNLLGALYKFRKVYSSFTNQQIKRKRSVIFMLIFSDILKTIESKKNEERINIL